MLHNYYHWTKRAIIITPIFIFIASILAGGGHGYYAPAIFLFPFGLSCALFGLMITPPFILLAMVQYPLYGLLLDYFQPRGYKNKTAVIILLSHAILVILILSLRSSTWQ